MKIDEVLMRKWEYIAKALEHLNAPSEIVEDAKQIDSLLVNMGLGYDTPEWKRILATGCTPDQESAETLLDIIYDDQACSACTTEDGTEVPCRSCKLGAKSAGCTPIRKYNRDYFTEVVLWVGANRRR